MSLGAETGLKHCSLTHTLHSLCTHMHAGTSSSSMHIINEMALAGCLQAARAPLSTAAALHAAPLLARCCNERLSGPEEQ